jgi:hypothetical protein
MRKRLKNKRRSCTLCKPHKRRGGNRWRAKDEERLRRWERERGDWQGRCAAGQDGWA